MYISSTYTRARNGDRRVRDSYRKRHKVPLFYGKILLSHLLADARCVKLFVLCFVAFSFS